MTEETVDCFNCGRANPEWAQVCRSCGVALRHGEARIVPTGPFPTDPTSLVSISAVIGTILAAVLLGLFVSSLNPTDPSVAGATATPSPSAEPSVAASIAPSPSDTAEPTPTPVPLRGTLAFGTGLDGAGNVTGATKTFGPNVSFAYALTVPGGVGAPSIRNEISRRSEPREVVQDDELANIDPADELISFNLGSAAGFIQDWGPGEYVWRVYVGEELVARAVFRLSEG
jgi:hypothetical protein